MIHKAYIRDVSLAPHGVTIIDTDPIEPNVGEKVAQKASLPDARGSATSAAPTVESPQPAHPVQLAQTTSVPSTPPETPSILLKEEVLSKAYKEVQSGKITDSQTIREIAAKFEAIARDPRANQSVPFDAERAAYNLYEQAKICEAEAKSKATPPSHEPARAKLERGEHHVNEDHLSSGGWIHDKG